MGAASLCAQPMPPPLSKQDLVIYKKAFRAAARDRWTSANNLAAQASDPLGAKVIRWLDYSRPYNFSPLAEIVAFMDDNPDWPDQEKLAASAETALSNGADDEEVFAWFRWRDPVSRDGRLRLAQALLRAGETERAVPLIREAWVNDHFSARDLRRVYSWYRKHLRPEDHLARLDRLLWANQRRSARRLYRYVDKGHQELAQARQALRGFAGGVDAAIARVPKELRRDPGLMYERLRWRRRKGRTEAAREILFDAPDQLGRPHLWWQEREIQIRKALSKGLIDEAYRLAKGHKQIGGADFIDAEWLAGWIALRFVKDPHAAYRHFARLHDAGTMPVTKARAGYWAGRAAEAEGDLEDAMHWYSLAARHPSAFYGQLAGTRVRSHDAPLLAEPSEEGHPATLEGHELVAVVRLLAFLGENRLLRTFILRLGDLAKGSKDHDVIARLAESIGRPDLAITAAKRAARDGYVWVEHLFPTVHVPFAKADEELEHALVLAVARQESGFHAKAKSHAGARGLMQLMPNTARLMARKLRIKYAKKPLTSNPAYNVTLGSTYLADLIRQYDGSYLLALGAYNAGPRNVQRWIRKNGDPRRDPNVDVVDWIESIPLSETRNYVQRVLEGLQVYRWRLGHQPAVPSLEHDLARGVPGAVLTARCDGASAAQILKISAHAAVC
jgi:soluble lytic murein transglycosylase